MEALLDEIRALALLSAANTVPVVVAKLVGDRWAAPLDFGWILPDGERLFGSHKTWRGLASGVVACTLVGLLFDLRPIVSAGFGSASLMADALSSAAKRRMHLEPGTEHVGQATDHERSTSDNAYSCPWIRVHISIGPARRDSGAAQDALLCVAQVVTGRPQRLLRTGAHLTDLLAGMVSCGAQQLLRICDDILQVSDQPIGVDVIHCLTLALSTRPE